MDGWIILDGDGMVVGKSDDTPPVAYEDYDLAGRITYRVVGPGGPEAIYRAKRRFLAGEPADEGPRAAA